MDVKNQFGCWFLTRKGNCKYYEKGKKDRNLCKLKQLLTRNGSINGKELAIQFLECYRINFEKNQKNGLVFWKTTVKQLTGRELDPMEIYEVNACSDILQGKKTKNSYGFNIPLTQQTLFDAFGITYTKR